MSRDKQIEEIVKDICPFYKEYGTCEECNTELYIDDEPCYWECIAKCIVRNGYRKAEDVAREIFAGLNEIGMVTKVVCDGKIVYDITDKFTEFKKKYESEDFIPAPPHTCAHIIPHTIESITNLAFPESEGEG